MSYTLTKRVTGVEPLTLKDVKHHLRMELEDTEQDMYLSDLMIGAIAYAEGQTLRSIYQADVVVTLRSTCTQIKLPLGVVEGSVVVTHDTRLQTVTYEEEEDFYLDYCAGILYMNSPLPTGTKVAYRVGYGVGDIPADMRQALLMLVDTLRQNSGDTTFAVQTYKSVFTSNMLLSRHRLY